MIKNLIKEENATSETFLSNSYKGIIFDCDGTLVNSMEYYFDGWKPLYEKRGLDFPRDRFYALAGVPVRRIIQIILEENKVGFDDDLCRHCYHHSNFREDDMSKKNQIRHAFTIVIQDKTYLKRACNYIFKHWLYSF